MTTNIKRQSIKLPGQFPQFFDFEESSLVSFMKYYYEWLETQGPTYHSQRITNYIDVDDDQNGYDLFDSFLRNEFLQNIPTNIIVDDRFLIKQIKDFYKAKGTEEAARILFRILYNEEVEFEYPGRYILRASDGRWLIEQSIKVVLIVDELSDISLNDFFVGATSNATAKIQKIEQKLVSGVVETEVFITNLFGTFIKGEVLKSRNTGEDLAIYVNEEDSFTTYPGRFTTTDGFLSSDRVLQDNYYYQEYSYVLKSGRDSKEYVDVLKKLSHPAGSIFFPEFSLKIYIDGYDSTRERYATSYTKQITYNIDFFELMKFELSSDVQQGSVAGKYVVVYEFDYWDIQRPDYTDDHQTTGTHSGETFIVSAFPSGFGVGDVVEITDTVYGASQNFAISEIISPTEFKVMREWPYGDSSLNFKFLKREFDDPLYSFGSTNIPGTSQNKIIDLVDYVDVVVDSYTEISSLNYSEMLIPKFLRTNENFDSKPIVKGTIVSITDNINSYANSYFVRTKLSERTLKLSEEYPFGEVGDVSFTVNNI